MKKPNEQGYEYAQSSKEPTRQDAIEYLRKGEPKADPKEKELYSIKPLEWELIAINHWFARGLIVDVSVLVDNMMRPYWRTGKYYSNEKHYCSSIEEAKRQAQDHFNSKLKLCLNREL